MSLRTTISISHYVLLAPHHLFCSIRTLRFFASSPHMQQVRWFAFLNSNLFIISDWKYSLRLTNCMLLETSRGEIDRSQDYVVGEEEAIWVLKLVLPYINEFLLKLRALFSGDPSTTMKVRFSFLYVFQFLYNFSSFIICVLTFCGSWRCFCLCWQGVAAL